MATSSEDAASVELEPPVLGAEVSICEEAAGDDLIYRYREVQEAFAEAIEGAFEKFLSPFAETFAVLKDVSLEGVPAADAVPELSEVDAADREAALSALQVLAVAGGSAAGVATAYAALCAVRGLPANGSVAVSVANRAAANLSDSWAAGVARARVAGPRGAARSKALFAQVNRDLVRNKKFLLAAAAVSGTAALFGWAYRADKAEYEAKVAASRQQQLQELADQQKAFVDALDRDRLLFLVERTEEGIQVLTGLTDVGVSRLPALRALAQHNDEYVTYSVDERLLVAEAAGLAQTVAAVVACPLLNQSPDEMSGDGQTADDAREVETLDAAHAAFTRYVRAPGTDAAVPAAATAAAVTMQSHRGELAYLLEQPELLDRMSDRFVNVGVRIREGHYFEWVHELQFNVDAIRNGSGLRASMTEWLGRPGDPADIIVGDRSGEVIREVQAKVVESNSQRVGPTNGLIAEKYCGMDLLLPKDHIPKTEVFLEKVQTRPKNGIFQDAYADAKTRMTDVISVEGISSDPITTGQLTEITENADGFLQGLARDTKLRQAASAAVASGGAAVVMSFASDIAAHVLAEGNFDGLAWTEAAVAAARTGAASAVAATAGAYVQSNAQQAVAAGSTSRIRESLAEGDLGPALLQASVDVSVIAHGLATGRLSPAEAARATAEAVTRSAVVWVCTAVGRNVFPDPVVGAMVGGIVGQYGAKVITHGIRVAVVGRDLDTRWDAAYDALLADLAALDEASAAERAELDALGEQCRSGFTDQVLPALSQLTRASRPAVGWDPDSDLADLAAIAGHFGGAPLFDSLEAFDAFMADRSTPLVLTVGRS